MTLYMLNYQLRYTNSVFMKLSFSNGPTNRWTFVREARIFLIKLVLKVTAPNGVGHWHAWTVDIAKCTIRNNPTNMLYVIMIFFISRFFHTFWTDFLSTVCRTSKTTDFSTRLQKRWLGIGIQLFVNLLVPFNLETSSISDFRIQFLF